MDRVQLLKICPSVPPALADKYLPHLNAAMARYAINTVEERACFLAQVLHESENLTRLVENLNYRPQALLQVFRGRFKPDQAARLGYIPGKQKADCEAIANIAYANRIGNGDVSSGDGWRYRGRGGIQLTGKDNYRRCGASLGVDFVKNPELVEQPQYAFQTSAWFWHEGNRLGHSLNALANSGEIAAITRAINPAELGLVERFNMSKRGVEILSA